MKKLLLLLIAFSTLSLMSQERIALSIYQDARLALTEDVTGRHQAFTLDILVKFNMEGNQTESGYLVISPLFEYANLDIIYKRYGIDVGFTFNQSVINGFSVTPSINYNIQDREGMNWMVFGADLEASYAINDRISINILGQAVERRDLKEMYDDYRIVFSGFIGLTIYLSKS